MCLQGAAPFLIPMVVGGVVAGINSLMDHKVKKTLVRAKQKAQTKQKVELIKQLDTEDSNTQVEQRELIQSAVYDLTNRNIKKIQALSTLRTALGESNIRGESMNRLYNLTENEFIRNENMVTENYKRNYAAIFSKQSLNKESTMSRVKELESNIPSMPSTSSSILNALTNIVSSGYSAGRSSV